MSGGLKGFRKHAVKGVANAIYVANTMSHRGGPISEVLENFLWIGNLYAAKEESYLLQRGTSSSIASPASFFSRVCTHLLSVGITHILGISQFAEDVKFFPDR